MLLNTYRGPVPVLLVETSTCYKFVSLETNLQLDSWCSHYCSPQELGYEVPIHGGATVPFEWPDEEYEKIIELVSWVLLTS